MHPRCHIPTKPIRSRFTKNSLMPHVRSHETTNLFCSETSMQESGATLQLGLEYSVVMALVRTMQMEPCYLHSALNISLWSQTLCFSKQTSERLHGCIHAQVTGTSLTTSLYGSVTNLTSNSHEPCEAPLCGQTTDSSDPHCNWASSPCVGWNVRLLPGSSMSLAWSLKLHNSSLKHIWTKQ